MVFCRLSRVEQAQGRHMITQKKLFLQPYSLLDGGVVLLCTHEYLAPRQSSRSSVRFMLGDITKPNSDPALKVLAAPGEGSLLGHVCWRPSPLLPALLTWWSPPLRYRLGKHVADDGSGFDETKGARVESGAINHYIESPLIPFSLLFFS
jgi:hypothetical protein